MYVGNATAAGGKQVVTLAEFGVDGGTFTWFLPAGRRYADLLPHGICRKVYFHGSNVQCTEIPDAGRCCAGETILKRNDHGKK